MTAPTTDARSKLLEVAARVYAETGYRGTTTRRIAQEADVNEVTLFRHFGSKDALLREAIERADREGRPLLDGEAADPIAELHGWALRTFERLYAHRNLIRQVMGDMVEFPAIAPRVCDDTNHEFDQLAQFFGRLAERGVILESGEAHLSAASAMLVHSLLSNALWRDVVPEIPPPDVCVRLYVELTLRALGVRNPITPGARP
jgi:AcrR family transcriptional regulator